ncbi:MAG: MgtC/SapB family protein [Spirochaetes bacterium]|nr:MgtC/SapB family protein [Spirochaetota bacterium]
MEMINLQLLQPFIIALFLGAILGFERTYASRMDHEGTEFLGGIRTYSLVSLFGSLVSFLSENYAPALLPIGFVGVIALTVLSHYITFVKNMESGITTEVSMLICFIVGVIAQKNHFVLALFVAITAAVVLHLKASLHRIGERLEEEDIRATLKFAIITFIILIFDPDYTFVMKDIGIFGADLLERFPGLAEVKVVNPYNVWLMVVLISAIGFTGYIATKIIGQRKGIGLTGLLGGLASSTATTIAFSRRSRGDDVAPASLSCALAVILACSTMFPRVILEVLVVNPALVPKLIAVMGAMAVAGFTFGLFLWRRSGAEKSEEVPLRNPFNIMPAVQFGLIFAVIVFVTRIVQVFAGDSGIYAVSVLAGLSDVDPITLTMSQISLDDPARLDQATVAITLAAFANTVMKAAMAAFLGSGQFRKIVLAGFAVTLMAGVAALFAVSVL